MAESIKKRNERSGLTTAEAEAGYAEWGFNELPHLEISLWWIFFIQFTGLMPYMLELAAVIAIAVEDYIDFAIIMAILIVNGYLGFHEELKAKASLDELTNKMEQKIAVLRDGTAEQLLTRLLVPGDVILMVGGCATPADVEWIEGDVLSMDTASITGEPLPRDYPSEQYGALILTGTTVKAGEAYCVVRKTGINTEVGGAMADIMEDKTKTKISLFEMRVLYVVKIIIIASLVDVLVILLVQGIARKQFTIYDIQTLLLTCLSIIVASIPVALPLVLQVTMALGAGKMAREFSAVVTSLPALQDISSMSVLCSDKTGTLTTARITIHAESVWCNDKFTQDEVALYSALASNRDKKEDPIDRSVINHFDKLSGPEGLDQCAKFTKIRGVGFNPIYKRVVFEFSHPTLGRVTIAKGLPAKVMNTADGGQDDALDQWVVENYSTIGPEVAKADKDFSKAGYKTLGVAVKFNDEPFRFIGILPMLDPPRHDTARTIRDLVAAGIKVKMITGDHQNIAIETARLIGMGQNIRSGEETRVQSAERDDLIWNADGFAQVLPRDKREVVLVLKETFKIVVGMTGDGVNDAPALSAAQCGIAVDDATDAAKNAAAIILTSPGLSAIYSAVVESRRIFRKLKSYVTYRFAASMQIVIVLTLLIYISNCPINSLYIILLALFNDLTMLPIAYDRQQASAVPETPDVTKMIILSGLLGILQTAFSLLWAYAANQTGFFQSDFVIAQCSVQAQSGVWVQMSIAAELLIFSARAPSYIVTSVPPSLTLFCSVMLGCFIFSLFAAVIPYFGYLHINDIIIIWAYDIICLFVIDVVKVFYLKLTNENTDVLPESLPADEREEEEDLEADVIPPADNDEESNAGLKRKSSLQSVIDEDDDSRAISVTRRLSNWSERNGTPSSRKTISESTIMINGGRKMSSNGITVAQRNLSAANIGLSPRGGMNNSTNTILVARSNTSLGSSAGLRGNACSLRPHTPLSVALARGFKKVNTDSI